MTVAELIIELQKVSNKSQEVATITETEVLCGKVLKVYQSYPCIILQLSNNDYGDK